MKRLLFFFLLCLLHSVAIAQWSVGIRAGVNNTGITRSDASRIDETYGNLCGYDFGINGRYAVNPWLSIRADLNLMHRNHRLQRHLNYLSPVYTNHLNAYINLPVMADFSFGGRKLRGHLFLGCFTGYWLWQHVEGTTYVMTDYEVIFNDFNEPRPFTRENRRFDAGLLGGLGLSYSLDQHIELNFDALYYYDLVSHSIGYPHLQDFRYLNTASLTFGISYRFFKPEQQ